MKKTNKVQLNHCPSCGSSAWFAFRTFDQEVKIRCQVCGLGTEWLSSKQEAADRWNNQPRIHRLEEEIARLVVENSSMRVAIHELSGKVLKKMLSDLAYVRVDDQPVPLKKCSRCDEMHPADEMVVVVGSPRRWICANCDQTK